MNAEIIILGNSSAIPAHGRGLSSQVLQHPESNYLIDCGEGTQFKLIENRLRLSKINSIFISHLHVDHILGLPGLLSTLGMQSRSAPLQIFAPPGLTEMLDVIFDHTATYLPFEIKINVVDATKYQLIHQDSHFKVYSLPLDHRSPCSGFKFLEKVKRNIHPDVIRKYRLNYDQINALKSGKDLSLQGVQLKSEECTFIKNEARSYAYLSDTAYKPSLASYVEGVDLLYHESTYTHDLQHLAAERKHSTAHQAAMLAKDARVKRLVIGHFSSRYKNLMPLLEEARKIFPSTFLAEEGKRFPL
jgi:ribonuclease Z